MIARILLFFFVINFAHLSDASNVCLKTCAPTNGFGDSCSDAPVTFPDNICADSVYCYLLNNLRIANCADKSSMELTLNARISQGGTSITSYTMTRDEGTNNTVFSKFSNSSNGTIPAMVFDPIIANTKIWVDSRETGKLCLYTDTIYGPQELLCKAIVVPPSNPIIQGRCSASGRSCFDSDLNYSMSLFNFSGITYQCLSDTLDRIFYINTYHCPTTNGVDLDLLNIFANFQNALRQTVMVALTLYVIFFGLKILMGEVEMKTSSGVMFLVKIILVGYFSVGLAPIPYLNNNYARQNGVVDFVLPILKQTMTGFASIVFNSGNSSGLCVFQESDYPEGRGYYAIWDSIDCRISHYMGMKLAWGLAQPKADSGVTLIKSRNLTDSNQTVNPIKFSKRPPTTNLSSFFTQIPFIQSADDATSGSIFSFIMLMHGFFCGGNIMVAIFGILFLLIFLSITLSVVSVFLVSLITLYALVYIAPIFVPMVLFKSTKPYFEAWLKYVFGISLQPMIVLGFLAIIVNVFDHFMYEGCSFVTETYSMSSATGLVSQKYNIYRLGYTDGNDDTCKMSLAYSFADYYLGNFWATLSLVFTYVSFVLPVNPMHTTINMFMLMLVSLILYEFADTVQSLATELSGGPSLGSVTVSAKMLVNAVIDIAKYVGEAVITRGESVKQDIMKEIQNRTGIKMDGAGGGGGDGAGGGEGAGGAEGAGGGKDSAGGGAKDAASSPVGKGG